MPLLFVYGTLKRGCRNHRELAGQRFLGEAEIGPGWALHDLGAYPGLVEAADAPAPIPGELWEVDDGALRRLDRFEGVDEGLYRRIAVPLRSPRETSAECYVFARDCSSAPRIVGGWREQAPTRP